MPNATKKCFITVLRITYISINVFYIIIRNLSVLGYVSGNKTTSNTHFDIYVNDGLTYTSVQLFTSNKE